MNRRLSTESYVEGVLSHNRAMLARAITLIESDAPRHSAQAQEVLQQLLPYSGRSIRIGITGVPGVGKSTLIEHLGILRAKQGEAIAVLAIDPSSTLTHGSIMGDKTRMEQLSQMPNVFIRPSPTSGVLGGVARKTRESIILCEAAGYTTIIIETVGVGQSEIAVRSMVDFFLLLLLAGAGDDLQALKKGIMEMADALVITKADGANRTHAEAARADYLRATHILAPATAGWQPVVLTSSALQGEGLNAIWETIARFRASTQASGFFQERRQTQARHWFHSLIAEELGRRFYQNPTIQSQLQQIEQEVVAGQRPVLAAVEELIGIYYQAR